MSRVALRDGQTVEVPDGLNTKGGKQDWLIQQGFTPKQVGLETVETETAGGVEDFFIGMGEFLADRGIGQQSDIRAPSGVGSFVGRSALPVAAGTLAALATGGTGLGLVGGTLGRAGVQAGTAAALEAPREGSTQGSIAGSAALGGAGSLGGDFLGRIMSGVGKSVAAARSARPQPVGLGQGVKGSPLQTLAQTARGGGGLNFAIKQNIKAINDRVGRVFGLSDDVIRNIDELDEEFLQVARTQVNDTYNAAVPARNTAFGTTRKSLEELKEFNLPNSKLNNLLKRFGPDDTVSPKEFTRIHRSLRDIRSETIKNDQFSGLVDTVDEAIDAFDEAAAAAGGNRETLTLANQRFKMLATIEEINAVPEEGVLPAGQLLRKLGRENFKGFGRRAIAEGETGRLLPEIEDLIKVGKEIAQFERQTAGGSATAGRQLLTKPLLDAFSGLAKGELSPGTALRLGTLGLGPTALGRAAVGDAGSGLLGPVVAQPLATRRADEQ